MTINWKLQTADEIELSFLARVGPIGLIFGLILDIFDMPVIR